MEKPRPRRISDFKPTLTKLAQTSHYEVRFGRAVGGLGNYLRKRGVDKRFIAHQYRKENLMENLFPLTESCLVESVGELIENGCEPDAYPCKICHQCVEKFVAFHMYDKCWTK